MTDAEEVWLLWHDWKPWKPSKEAIRLGHTDKCAWCRALPAVWIMPGRNPRCTACAVKLSLTVKPQLHD